MYYDDKRIKQKLLLTILLLSAFVTALFLTSCAGITSDQTPTINGDNNTVTINQTPSVDKASKTSIDAAGAGVSNGGVTGE